jgi:hypothetical protein
MSSDVLKTPDIRKVIRKRLLIDSLRLVIDKIDKDKSRFNTFQQDPNLSAIYN